MFFAFSLYWQESEAESGGGGAGSTWAPVLTLWVSSSAKWANTTACQYIFLMLSFFWKFKEGLFGNSVGFLGYKIAIIKFHIFTQKYKNT